MMDTVADRARTVEDARRANRFLPAFMVLFFILSIVAFLLTLLLRESPLILTDTDGRETIPIRPDP